MNGFGRRAAARSRALAAQSLTVALISWASVGRAQTAQTTPAAQPTQGEPDLATRRMLIEQAQQARSSGDHRVALERAEQAMRIQLTPSLRLFIAQTLGSLGRPADALTQAEACVREAERDAALPNRDALLTSCRQILDESRPAIATLTVEVRGAVPRDATIVAGSRSVAAALVGVPIAINPGRLTVVARAVGFATIERSIELARGERRSIELSFEPVVAPSALAPRPNPSTPPVDARPRTTAAKPFPIGPVVTLSIGGASLVASAVTFALRNGAISPCPIESDRFVCADARAANALIAAANSAETLNTITNITLVTGGVLLAGGAAWLVVDRLRPGERAPVTVAPSASNAQLGLVAGGQF